MASSNILLFDANKANMMSDEQYNTNTQRLNGVQSGIASSQLQNKTLYQCSLVAYAIAQVMNQNGLDANDTAAVSAFVANLSGTMLQKVADLATTEEAKAGVATGKWMSPALVKAAMDTFTANKWLPLAGGTMQGNLILNTSSPINALQAASKGYVDGKINDGVDGMLGSKWTLLDTWNIDSSVHLINGVTTDVLSKISEIAFIFDITVGTSWWGNLLINFMGTRNNGISVGRVQPNSKGKFCLKFIVSSKSLNTSINTVTFGQTRESSTSLEFDIQTNLTIALDSGITGITGTIKTLWR